MAEQNERRIKVRNIVHCLKCFKPQEKLPEHLARVCMKQSDPEERAAAVREARKSFKDWAKAGRIWDYKALCKMIPDNASRYRVMQDLLQRGCFVTNQPDELDMASAAEPPTAGTSASTAIPQPSAPTDSPVQSAPSSPSSSAGEGPSDPTRQRDVPAPTSSVRKNMVAAGLYEKFAETTALLLDFKKYLLETLKVPECQQEVDNVSRFLRYVQPTGDELTLDFLQKMVETRDYFVQLKNTSMTPATILNYMKNVIRFLDYLKTRVDLECSYPELRNRCQVFKEFIQTVRKQVSRSNTRRTVKKRWTQLIHGDTEKAFLEHFPVTVDGSAPPAKRRREAGFPAEDRSLTYRWHNVQRDQRAEHLLSKFKHRQPTEKQFNKCVERMNWKTNKPKYEALHKLWTPPQKEDITNNQKLLKSVMSQKWRGLSIKDFDGDKGKGVITNRPFVKGEIVCDYHGNIIGAAEGRAMLEAQEGVMCYLFFFKDGQRDLCVDAQTHPCTCHADRDMVGRRINHSAKKPNLKPVHVRLDHDGEQLDVILFKALVDIQVGKELKFNHGVDRKSHRGEGLDLEWLDE
ncbi:uncharacterized protein LOC117820035 [Notolabrus celidotus]|uniref:uncharacterized protein LOC117820035 n=1 Tax=Notolabrus celidotus TaxID=1203425 RepID=UPI00148FEB42|nr:uncharacterized protein LOC117820035 [Notolabrus celidotus]